MTFQHDNDVYQHDNEWLVQITGQIIGAMPFHRKCYFWPFTKKYHWIESSEKLGLGNVR